MGLLKTIHFTLTSLSLAMILTMKSIKNKQFPSISTLKCNASNILSIFSMKHCSLQYVYLNFLQLTCNRQDITLPFLIVTCFNGVMVDGTFCLFENLNSTKQGNFLSEVVFSTSHYIVLAMFLP